MTFKISWAAFSSAALATTAFSDLARSADLGDSFILGQQEVPMTLVPRGLAASLGPTEFDSTNAFDVEDLLKYTPDLVVGERSEFNDSAVITLRGTNGTQSARTLVMIDGFVVSNLLGNSENFAPKLNFIGPSEAQQLDVVYGPYAARYGGNSMGGVVSLTTRQPTQKAGYVTLRSYATPFERFGIDETFTGYSAEAGGSWQQPSSPWSARLSARHTQRVADPMAYALLAPSAGPAIPVTGAYVDPQFATPVYGADSPSEIVQNQFRASVGYKFAGGWEVEGILFGWLTRQERTDPRSFLRDAAGVPVYTARVNLDGTVYTATGLDLSLERRSEFLAGIKASGTMLGWQSAVNLSHYWIDTQDDRTSRDYSAGVTDGGGMLTLQESPGWSTLDAQLDRTFGRHHLAVGFNGNQYTARQSNYSTVNWRLASSPFFRSETFGDTRSVGLYAEDRISLTSTTSLTLGARADRWEAYDGGAGEDFTGTLESDRYPERQESAASPKLTVETALGKNLLMQLNLATATRFPTVGELFQGRIDPATGGLDPESFNPALRPEQSRDANFLLRRDFQNVSVTSSFFYQEIEDAILGFVGDDRSDVVTSFRNVERTRQFGVELTAEATDVLVDGLDLQISVTRLDARTVRDRSNPAADNRKSPGIPKWRSSGVVRYRLAQRLNASLGWRYAARPNPALAGVELGDYGYRGEYFFIDARLTWNLNDALKLGVGVDNASNDKVYATHPLPQRTGFAEFTLQF